MSTNKNTPDEVPMRDAALGFALRKTIADRVSAEVKGERLDLQDRLLKRMRDEGVKQTMVSLPDGTPVATLTVSQPRPVVEAVDPEGLLEWARENQPEWVETVEHEAVEAWTEYRLTPEALAGKGLTQAAGGTLVTSDGEQVPGLRRTTPAPKSFAVKYADGGADALVEAWLGGELAAVDAGATLPTLGELESPEDAEVLECDEDDVVDAEVVEDDEAPAAPIIPGFVDVPLAGMDAPPAWDEGGRA